MSSNTGKISPSRENYLKVMLELSGGERIRSTDIANALGVSKASVSNMMNILREEGYVDKENYGAVCLTNSGRSVAADIKRKYDLLRGFLLSVLGVDAVTAAEDACRMEHLISQETANRLGRQLEQSHR
jgi:DtxR family Mn-dependent transcriptional regulator